MIETIKPTCNYSLYYRTKNFLLRNKEVNHMSNKTL